MSGIRREAIEPANADIWKIHIGFPRGRRTPPGGPAGTPYRPWASCVERENIQAGATACHQVFPVHTESVVIMDDPPRNHAMSDRAGFLGSLLDTLDDQIAVLDAAGRIIYVNAAWVRFGQANGMAEGHDWIGDSYLQVCSDSANAGDAVACSAHAGILAMLRGEMEHFQFEYPCHSPVERRWFLMRMTPLHGVVPRHYVVSHLNITQRKLVEERMEALSLTDPLTGLANRRHFALFLHEEWLRNMRERTPLTLVMFDLDYFKRFNDTHGHVAGDHYLSEFGAILRRHARRPADLATRYGGEEFALILGNTDLHVGEMIAGAVLVEVTALRERMPPGATATTASAGVACVTPASGMKEALLIEWADQAVYQSKQAGRNRVTARVA